ncbi:cytochrome c [bacterium SCSIO 12741]|nr:cytochrome c [bacterium SCSIO 12741]
MKRISILLAVVTSLGLMLGSCFNGTREYGKEMYMTHCSNCHGIEGDGLQELYPPLKNSDYLLSHQDQLACIIRYGLHDTIQVNGVEFNMGMTPIPVLSDIDIHNVINYLSREIDTQIQPVTIQDVQNQLDGCQD